MIKQQQQLRIQHYLQSTPIEYIEPIGKWDAPNGFSDAPDFKRAQSPVFLEQVKTAFNKTPYRFNLYFTNEYKGSNFVEKGSVTRQWLYYNMPNVYKQLNMKPFVDTDPNVITVIFTNNIGTDKLMLTPWIIAHRISHALDMNYSVINIMDFIFLVKEFIQHNYNYKDKELVKGIKLSGMIVPYYYIAFIGAICKFKSAKDVKREGELFHELLAQYIVQGSVTFNKPPKDLFIKGIPELTRNVHSKTLAGLTKYCNVGCKSMLDAAKGSILVM